MSFPYTELIHNSSLRARVVAALCAALLLSASFACKSEYPASGQQKGPGAGRGGEARQGKVARGEELPVGASVNVTGTLAAQDEATLSIKVPGRVNTMTVDLGSVVRRGQVIAQVEQGDRESTRRDSS